MFQSWRRCWLRSSRARQLVHAACDQWCIETASACFAAWQQRLKQCQLLSRAQEWTMVPSMAAGWALWAAAIKVARNEALPWQVPRLVLRRTQARKASAFTQLSRCLLDRRARKQYAQRLATDAARRLVLWLQRARSRRLSRSLTNAADMRWDRSSKNAGLRRWLQHAMNRRLQRHRAASCNMVVKHKLARSALGCWRLSSRACRRKRCEAEATSQRNVRAILRVWRLCADAGQQRLQGAAVASSTRKRGRALLRWHQVAVDQKLEREAATTLFWQLAAQKMAFAICRWQRVARCNMEARRTQVHSALGWWRLHSRARRQIRILRASASLQTSMMEIFRAWRLCTEDMLQRLLGATARTNTMKRGHAFIYWFKANARRRLQRDDASALFCKLTVQKMTIAIRHWHVGAAARRHAQHNLLAKEPHTVDK